jgi:hypothetical protein
VGNNKPEQQSDILIAVPVYSMRDIFNGTVKSFYKKIALSSYFMVSYPLENYKG